MYLLGRKLTQLLQVLDPSQILVSSGNMGCSTLKSPLTSFKAIKWRLPQCLSLATSARESGPYGQQRQSYAVFSGAPLNSDLSGGHERSQEFLGVEFFRLGIVLTTVLEENNPDRPPPATQS